MSPVELLVRNGRSPYVPDTFARIDKEEPTVTKRIGP